MSQENKGVLEKMGGFGEKIKTIIYIYIIPIVVATNTFNILWNTGTQNAAQIEYNDNAQKRRIENAISIQALRDEILLLKKEKEFIDKMHAIELKFEHNEQQRLKDKAEFDRKIAKFKNQEYIEDIDEWKLKYKELKEKGSQ